MQMQGTDLDEAKNSDTQLSGNGTFQEFSRLTESIAPSQLAWGRSHCNDSSLVTVTQWYVFTHC